MTEKARIASYSLRLWALSKVECVMHNKSVNRTAKKLRFLPSGYVQRYALVLATAKGMLTV
ncbi:hypothetical protein GALL_269880 [mine drainage metagenome]|uniref:Uncharacterized protein n=1 Tax=mine drainage metagenome TaxID=410659 RepID=A0A1J5RG48_9ZZZZ